MLSMIVLVLTLVGLGLAMLAVSLLRDVAALVPTPRLKRAWKILSLIILACVAIQLVALNAKLHSKTDLSDVLAACVHLLGPVAVLTMAFLSRNTARDLVRVPGLERDALIDPLTGLSNRRHFDAQLVEAIAAARRKRDALDLVMLDIDHFKRVNDTFGHGSGDLVLKQVATLIAGAVAGTGAPYRIGGEEFAVILPGSADARTLAVIERLRHVIESCDLLLTGGGTTRVTASLGAATLSEGDRPNSFVERADTALYVAKRTGRNRAHLAA